MRTQAIIAMIVGSSRSGTTMLNRILGRHPRVLALEELHYFGGLWNPASDAHPLGIGAARRLSRRLILRARHGIWHEADNRPDELDVKFIDSLTGAETGWQLYSCTLSYLASRNDCDVVVDQTPRNLLYAKAALVEFPHVRVLHVIRDGRAVLYSQRRRWRQRLIGASHTPLTNSIRVLVNYHPLTAALLWRRSVQKGIALGEGARVCQLRYESMVDDPVRELSKAFSLLELNYSPEFAEVPRVGSSHFRHTEHVGIHDDSRDAWQSGLTPGEEWLAGLMAGRVLEQYGYPLRPRKSYSLLSGTGWLLVFPFHVLAILLVNARLACSVARRLK